MQQTEYWPTVSILLIFKVQNEGPAEFSRLFIDDGRRALKDRWPKTDRRDPKYRFKNTWIGQGPAKIVQNYICGRESMTAIQPFFYPLKVDCNKNSSSSLHLFAYFI